MIVRPLLAPREKDADMKRASKVLGLVGGIWMLSGCATTNITSQADVTAKTATYDTVMVIAAFDDLDLRKLGEGEMKIRLAAHGVTCIPSSEMFFPGDSYSGEDVRAKMAERQINGILVISAYDAGTTEAYMPPTYYTQGSAWVSGNRVSGSSTTHTTGGYTYRKPWAKFRGELIDVRTEHRTWVATAKSKGNAYASGHTLLRSFCGQVMNQLVTDGIVKPAPTPAR